ncbi:glycosyltransferase [Microbacterium istanbulense]|uniref:Glycosyltransferase n=1 Tax=Microbacterium istanbulense TaxID=3122049 RepID=A0ABU8LJK9_9MICO
MQIVVVTTWFPTNRHPGAGSFIQRDIEALSAVHDVKVVHLVPPELDDGIRASARDGYDVVSPAIDVRTPAGLITATRRMPELTSGADVVHTMAAPALLPFLLRRPTAPWVHTEHWSGVAKLRQSAKARLALPLSRRAFGRPDELVAVSEYLAEAVRPLRRGPVEVIGNIIEPVHAVEAGTWFTETPALKVLGIGTVNEHKGWRIAVDAVTSIRAAGTAAELLWLGSGPDSEALAQRAAAGDVVAPGQVSAADVRSALEHADVFVLPTRSETFSLATAEALAAGVPVVATGVGGHLDFLAPEAGVHTDRTAPAVASAIRKAATFDRERVRLHGQQLLTRYSAERFVDAYTKIYERVTNG